MRTGVWQHSEVVSHWDRDENAAAYQRFCEDFAYYPSGSAALVRAAAIATGEKVADLGCGTGVTTRALVSRLGDSGALWAVDPAAAMLRVAQAAKWPQQVRFVLGDIATLVAQVPPESLDVIVCASAVWLPPNRHALLRKVAQALRAGGRFALSIPSEFIGESTHLLDESATRFLTTLVQVRQELALAPPLPPQLPIEPPSLGAWRESLSSVGFARIEVGVHPYVMTHAEWAAHLCLPVVLDGLLPLARESQRQQFAQQLLARLDPIAPAARPWHILVAWRG